VAREIVGLKIGASKIGAARVAMNGTGRVLQVASAPLPEAIVSGGEVKDPEALGEALRALFAEHKLPRRAVRVGVSSNRVGVRTIELSGIHDPKQLGNAVRFRAQEALPIPLTEAVLDYQVLSEHKDADGQTVYRVQFAVAYRDLVEGFARACTLAGVRLVGVDLEAFALLRALTPLGVPAPEGEDPSALVVISVGSERSTLAVTDGSVCEFTRVLDWGGAAITAAIAAHLGVENDEAERVKRLVSLNADAAIPEGIEPERATRVRELMVQNLQGFARELVSSLQFYQNQPGSLGIREIVLAGGTARLDGLATTLSRMVAVAVRIGDPLANLAGPGKIKGGEPDPSLAIAIGLGMGA
jgi:type IV pilus assembly protein PilM